MNEEKKAMDSTNPANSNPEQQPQQQPKVTESLASKPATASRTASTAATVPTPATPVAPAAPNATPVATITPSSASKPATASRTASTAATVPTPATPVAPAAPNATPVATTTPTSASTAAYGTSSTAAPVANPYNYKSAQQVPASTSTTYSTYGTGNANTYNSYPQASASTTPASSTPYGSSTQSSYPYSGQQYNVPAPKPKGNGKIGLIVICIILSLVSGMLGSLINIDFSTKSEPTPIEIPFNGNPWADVSEYLLDSTIWVYLEFQYQGYVYGASGSGVVISSDGYVLTNHHVINAPVSSPIIEIYFYNDDVYSAEVVATDAGNDLALLKINATGLTPVRIGNPDSVRVGDEVLGIGNQLGAFPDTVTNGIISHLADKIPYDSLYSPTCFQTNLGIMPGNSGGGLFNHQGDLIGINSASYYQVIELSDGRLVTPEVSYAITIDLAINLINRELGDGYISDNATLDIELTTVSDKSDASNRGYSDVGVYIDSVGTNGPAYFAGLKEGDRIVSIGSKIISTESDFSSAINGQDVGDYIEITIARGGQQYIYTIQLSRELVH